MLNIYQIILNTLFLVPMQRVNLFDEMRFNKQGFTVCASDSYCLPMVCKFENSFLPDCSLELLTVLLEYIDLFLWFTIW